VDVKFTNFSLKLGALPTLSLPLDLFSPTGALVPGSWAGRTCCHGSRCSASCLTCPRGAEPCTCCVAPHRLGGDDIPG
jgi:hypothetical protein